MGGKTSTSSSQVQIPPEVLARYSAVNAQAQQVAQTPFKQYSTDPNAFVAPTTAEQNGGFANTNTYANAAQPGLSAAADYAVAGGQAVNANPLTSQNINQYLSPFLGDVYGATVGAENYQNQTQASGLQGAAINAGAFGGDRSGIAEANLAYQQDLANSQTNANLLNTGYNTALSTAQQQQGVDLAAAQANRAALQNTSGQLAGISTAAQTAGLQGAQAQIAAGTVQQQTNQAGDTALYNQFLQQQAYPFQTTQFLANIAEGTGALSGSTTNTTQPSSFFSDERLKEDIEPIGKTFDGQNIVKFRYKGEKGKQIGLIAQDVEKHHPEAVGLARGYKTVDYDQATRKAATRGHFYRGGLALASDADQGFAFGGTPTLPGAYAGMDLGALLQAQQQSQAGVYGAAGRGMSGTPGVGGYVPAANGPVGHLAQASPPPRQQAPGLVGGLAAVGNASDNVEKVWDAGEGLGDFVDRQTAPDLTMGNYSQNPLKGETFSPDQSIDNLAGANFRKGGRVHRAVGGDIPYGGDDGYVPDSTAQTAQQLAVAKAPGQQQSGLGSLIGGIGQAAGAVKGIETLGGAAEGAGSFIADALPFLGLKTGGRIGKAGGGDLGPAPYLNLSDIYGDNTTNPDMVIPAMDTSAAQAEQDNIAPIRRATPLRTADQGLGAATSGAQTPSEYDIGDVSGVWDALTRTDPKYETSLYQREQNGASPAAPQGLAGLTSDINNVDSTAPALAPIPQGLGAAATPSNVVPIRPTASTAPPPVAAPQQPPTGGLDAGSSNDTIAAAPQAGGLRPATAADLQDSLAQRATGLNKQADDTSHGWFYRNKDTIVPILAGLGDMASSQSRYLGSALLQGIAGGAKSAVDVQNQENTLANQASTTQAGVSEQNARALEMRSLISKGNLFIQPGTNVPMGLTDNGSDVGSPVPYWTWVANGRKQPLFGQSPTTSNSGSTAAGAPAPTRAPLPPAYKALADANAARVGTMGVPEGAGAPGSPDSPWKEISDSATAARAGQLQTNTMIKALSELPATEGGPWSQEVALPLERYANDLLTRAGAAPIPETTGNVGSAELINKIQQAVASVNLASVGGRSQSELAGFKGALPSFGNSPQGRANMAAFLLTQQQAPLDEQQKATIYQNYLSDPSNPNALSGTQAQAAGRGFHDMAMSEEQPLLQKEYEALRTMYPAQINGPDGKPVGSLIQYLMTGGRDPAVLQTVDSIAKKAGLPNARYLMRYFGAAR